VSCLRVYWRSRIPPKGRIGGRVARNCWSGGSAGSMCSVCPATACVGAKVEAGSCPAAFAGDYGELTLPCWNLWRNQPTCRWKLALRGRKGHAGHERCAEGAKEERSWAESKKGMDRENREEMREEVPVRKREIKSREKGRKQTARGRGTGDPLHTLGLADITRHTQERNPRGR
jgi:hypothetical protein